MKTVLRFGALGALLPALGAFAPAAAAPTPTHALTAEDVGPWFDVSFDFKDLDFSRVGGN